MTDQKTLEILKLFYFGCENMEQLAKRTKVPREEIREVLKSARDCGLISYKAQDYNETFCKVRKDKLQIYLKTKGILK